MRPWPAGSTVPEDGVGPAGSELRAAVTPCPPHISAIARFSVISSSAWEANAVEAGVLGD